MKALIKYLSLLLFSGLIIPLYNNVLCSRIVIAQTVQVSTTELLNRKDAHGFSFYDAVVAKLFPVLKNLE